MKLIQYFTTESILGREQKYGLKLFRSVSFLKWNISVRYFERNEGCACKLKYQGIFYMKMVRMSSRPYIILKDKKNGIFVCLLT